MNFIQAILKAMCFSFWIKLLAILAYGFTSKMGLTKLEKLICGMWSSMIGIGLWLILILK